jgi:predicted ATP-dependent endonuclease of OLD family
MELVYLWVEKYKNIENQGFNFSPRFTCQYDTNIQELTIEESKKDVSIFPPNINVTAIVGENGSGKSSILELLKLILEDKNATYKGFLVWKSGKFDYNGNMKIKIYYKKKLIDIVKNANNKIDFFTHSSDVFNTTLWMNQKNKLYDCEDDMIFNRLNSSHPNELRTVDLSLNLPLYFGYSQNETLFYLFKSNRANKVFNPTKYKLELSKTYFIRKLTAILNYSENEPEKIKMQVQDYVQNTLINLNIKTINRLYLFLEKLQSNNDKKAHTLVSFVRKKTLSSETMEDLLSKTYHSNDYSFTLELLDKLDYENENFLNDDKELLLDILQDNLSKNIFIDVYRPILYAPLEKDFYKTYDDLSTGEKDSLLLIALLYNYFEKVKNGCIVLLDEVEASYHPNWAKELFSILFDELKNKNIHLVITSHSPFILSDIPKENVIFLENGKQVDPKIETFGANIHTLLSHGFFMKEGLMGEFAKGKINEVIKLLNQKTLDEKEIKYCENIISIIGEPLLQNTLKHQLSEKLNPNETELQKLQREQQEIQSKIDKLTGKKQ